MKPRLRPSLLPQCSACARSYIELGFSAWRLPIQQQTRGAKSSARKPDGIAVQLLKDLDKFGKQGQFVPVSSGMMRNTWFPARVARYPDFDERRAIKAGTIEVERNYEFDASARDAVIRKTEEAPVRPTGSIENAWKKYLGESIEEIKPQAVMEAAIEAAQIEPNRAIALLDVLLPTNLEFTRNPVPRAQSEVKSKLPESVQQLLKANTPRGPMAIYGSVSTADIAAYIKENIGYNDEAAQIQISEKDIVFIGLPEGEDSTRVKHLGQFEVEISYKGADNTLKKKVFVVEPRNDDPEKSDQPKAEAPLEQSARTEEVLQHR